MSDNESLEGLSSSFDGDEEDDEEEDEEEEEGEQLFGGPGGRRRQLADDSDLLEICVETLVGTVFDMRLKKKETISNIKTKLMRMEGIPKHHLHLLYRSKCNACLA